MIGLDPEPEMLRLAEADRPANVTFREGSSRSIGPDMGVFRLVTMGRAFHWMDRPETLRRLDGMIEPGGAVALFGEMSSTSRARIGDKADELAAQIATEGRLTEVAASVALIARRQVK